MNYNPDVPKVRLGEISVCKNVLRDFQSQPYMIKAAGIELSLLPKTTIKSK